MEAFGGRITQSSPLKWEEGEAAEILTINSFILDKGNHARVLVEADGIEGEVSCAILTAAQPHFQCHLVFPKEAQFVLASSSDAEASVSILGTSDYCNDFDENCCDEDESEESDGEYSDDTNVPSLIMADFESSGSEAGSDEDEESGPKIEEVFDEQPEKREIPVRSCLKGQSVDKGQTGSPSNRKLDSSNNKTDKDNHSSVGSKKSEGDKKRAADTTAVSLSPSKNAKTGNSNGAGTAQRKDGDKEQPSSGKKAAVTTPNIKKVLPSGLKYEITRAGNGQKCALKGRKVTVAYSGSLASSGKQFDKGQLSFVVGAGEVVPGFDQGVEGMVLGESRMCFIPAKLGYGKKGAPGVIPPNANLVFDIKLTKC